MSRTLETSQAALMTRDPIASITLAVWKIWTDYDNETVNRTYYLSYPTACHYDWDDSGTDRYFEDLISELSVPTQQIQYPPERSGFTSRSVLTMTLANVWSTIDAKRVWRQLGSYNIIGSHLTVAELLLDPDRYRVDGREPFWDLRDLTGDEHTVLFRGEGEQVEEITEESITIRFASLEPRVPHIELLNSGDNDPRDFGSQLPTPYGSAKHVPCKNMIVGWMTTLAEPLAIGETGVRRVTDATGFPTSTTFDIICGSEIIECTDSDATSRTITINARGHDNTADATHLAGDQIMELVDEVVFGIAGDWITDMPAFYLQNPFNQELVLFDAEYLYRRGDQRTDKFSLPAGSRFSTLTIDRDEFVEWLVSARTSARVTVQPEFDDGSGASGTPTADPDDTNEEAAPGPVGYGVWSGTAANPVWTSTAGATRTQLVGDWDGAQNTDTILRFRFKLQATLSGWTSGVATLRCKGMNMLAAFGDPILITASGNAQYTAYTSWRQPATTKTLDDLRIDGEDVTLQPRGDVGCVWTVNEWTVEAETNPGSGVSRETDTEIAAAATGFGLQAFADIDGPFVPYEFDTTDYDFEEGGSGTWDTSSATQTRSTTKQTGTYSQQITVTSATGVMQYNTVGGTGVDLSSYNDFYRISLRGDSIANITSLRFWLATTGVGSTIPTNRLEIEVPVGTLREDEWIEFYNFGVRYGSPFTALTDCDCFGAELITSGGSASVYFDDLRTAASTSTNYDDVPGTLIEAGPDIIRHFIADHCGLGHDVIDDTSFDTALTNLGTNVYAGIMNGLGTTFDDILSSLLWETRSHLVRAEGSSDILYKLYAADSSGDYTTPTKTLSDWIDLRWSFQDRSQLFTRSRAFWAWDPFLGFDERAFTEVTRADPDVDDTGLGNFSIAETQIGRIDSGPIFFYFIQDETTAEDTLKYYARIGKSHKNNLGSMSMELPTWQCFDLEPGDTREFPTSEWKTGISYALILAVYRTPGEPTGRVEMRIF
jgi:hypothetical protein